MRPFLDFLDSSPTAFHAVASMAALLQQAGFHYLSEDAPWTLKAGGAYFVTPNGSALLAFHLPQRPIKRAIALASHTDSPCLKLKPNAEFRSDNMVLWGVEIYGEPLLSSWLNRDLALGGRIFFGAGQVQQALVRYDRAAAVLPQLAVHLDREVNDKGLILNRQEQLQVLAALDPNVPEGSTYLESLLESTTKGLPLLCHELFLYPLETARLIGNEGKLVSGYRLDNLSSAYGMIQAKLRAPKAAEDALQILAFWDSEEIGSHTPQGADSPALTQLLRRIADCMGLSDEEKQCALARSLCVSVDVAHSVHPSYPNKHEPRHSLLLGKGVCLKYNAKSRYAFDGAFAAWLLDIAAQHQIPMQKYVGRGDIPCGSTVGPLIASRTGMRTVDIGCPQLSMHAAREVMATEDIEQLTRLLALVLQEF